MGYANGTSVPAERSRGEIEKLVEKYAGRDADFSYGRGAGQAAISFMAKGRRVQFSIPMPTKAEAEQEARDGRAPSRKPTPSQCEAWLEQETRRRWRCLLLIVKAKFAAVEIWEELGQGDEAASAFDREFLAHIQAKGGRTIFDVIRSAGSDGQRLLPAVEHNATGGTR